MTDVVILLLVIPVINCILISTGNWQQILVLLILSIYPDSDDKLKGIAMTCSVTVVMLTAIRPSIEMFMVMAITFIVLSMVDF